MHAHDASSSPRRVGLRLAALAFAATSFAACNAIFGVDAGQPAGPTSSGTGGAPPSTSSSTGGATSSSGTGGATTSSSGTGGTMVDAGPVCDGSGPGADGTNARWAFNAGGSWEEAGYAVAFAAGGTFIVAGTYSDSGTSLHSGPLPYASGNGNDVFVARYDLAGNNVWAQGYGGPGDQGLASFLRMRNNGLRLAVGPQDQIFLAGSFEGTFTIGSTLDEDKSRHADAFDGFVARLGPDGVPAWAKRLGGPDDDLVFGLGADRQGNVVVAGVTANIDDTAFAADFGCGAVNVDVQPMNASAQWLFVTKLDAGGACVWGKHFQIDSGFHDLINIGHGYALTLDPNDDVILALGATPQSTYIGQGQLGSSSDSDVVLVKLDHVTGDPVWKKAYGGTGIQRAWAVATDACGNVVVGGEFDEQATFGTLGPLALPPDSGADPGSTHAFVARFALDADPTKPPSPVWAVPFMDDGWQTVTGLAVDDAGKVTVVGSLIDGPASAGVDFGDHAPMAPVADDAGAYEYHPSFYVVKLGADGAFHFARRWGDTHANTAYAVAVDTSGHTVVTGSAQMKVDFGGQSSPLDPSGLDAFVVLYGP